ncbi:hypothetical protein DFA_08493 [Cavenderia fasciculata]|uniref:Phospholipase/carboxylesterase/thioesterase domain-containing protein n=1 Tax=Cavenderia fasciculata TaxID=261658 RepID=F4Q2N0_CACFS|nr:uncharacterized protein DFA_08493 [Cavenderia fasciculata]EGG17497.1 hypothetical protein DFA_08493 [Cavenderia fasciculata]|eukprot:XP_004355981.1 hypothetical protein DFA_08493 [Cavenderia fasciculata]
MSQRLNTKSFIIILVLLFNIFSIYKFNQKINQSDTTTTTTVTTTTSSSTENNLLKMESKSYDFKNQDGQSDTLYYLEYKPPRPSQDYRYPVFIFLHGASKSGKGLEDLNTKLRTAVIPKYIEGGQWGSLPFLVICPQSSDGWTSTNIVNVLGAIKTTYKDIIDDTRIYLTGQSMGGGGIWRWALASKEIDDIAALIVICGAACKCSTPQQQSYFFFDTNYYNLYYIFVAPPYKIDSNEMVSSNIPVWAFNNENDSTVSAQTSQRWVDINNQMGISPPSKITIFKGVTGHDAWTQAFNPIKQDNPTYVYDWLLSFTNIRKHNRTE